MKVISFFFAAVFYI